MKTNIKNTIYLGYANNQPVKLNWRNSNGMLIAGISGTGKSQTASFYLAEYAYNGTKLILCDYNAALGIQETLLDRVSFLEPAFLLPPATNKDQIVQYIEYTKELGAQRLNRTIPESEHYPIILAIDEFPAFLMDYDPVEVSVTRVSGDKRSEGGEQKTIERQNGFLQSLISSILAYRKVNIHFMLIGQEWAQMGTTGVRALRSNITDKVFHRMDTAQCNLFDLPTIEKRTISTLPTGHVLYNGNTLHVPLLTDSMIDEVMQRLSETEKVDAPILYLDWTPQDQAFLDEMLAKYMPKLTERYIQEIQLDNMDDLIRLLVKKGKSQNWIEQHVRLSRDQIRKKIQSAQDFSD